MHLEETLHRLPLPPAQSSEPPNLSSVLRYSHYSSPSYPNSQAYRAPASPFQRPSLHLSLSLSLLLWGHTTANLAPGHNVVELQRKAVAVIGIFSTTPFGVPIHHAMPCALMMSTKMVLVSLAVLLATIGASDAAWCVCRSDVSDPALQKTIDYACGAGADCMPILQNGACFQPNTVRSHCSWAANSYYQRRGQMGATCDFSGTATLSTSDPSYGSCSYPASASAAGTAGGTTPSTFTNTTGGFSPGILGLGPSGANTLPDGSDGGLLLKARKDVVVFVVMMLSAFLAHGLV